MPHDRLAIIAAFAGKSACFLYIEFASSAERIGHECSRVPPRIPAPDQRGRRERRAAEVNFARGSIRYEGGILSDEIERLNARYIAGELTSDELTTAILASDTVRLG